MSHDELQAMYARVAKSGARRRSPTVAAVLLVVTVAVWCFAGWLVWRGLTEQPASAGWLALALILGIAVGFPCAFGAVWFGLREAPKVSPHRNTSAAPARSNAASVFFGLAAIVVALLSALSFLESLLEAQLGANFLLAVHYGVLALVLAGFACWSRP
ncbi:MAG: hypothetical protein SH850_17250 [Planctomycetaceae bacterium]|nr:hypothetical protein [Planctomycetaceae bacterium]MDZ4755093.1 hypothetical protein [Phycisphaerae bacterium]